jgi:magnesium-transporting ATPase (P-type)
MASFTPNNLTSSLSADDYAIMIGEDKDDRESSMDDGNGRMSFERASHIIAMRSSTIITDNLKEDPAHEALEKALKGLTDREVLDAREKWGKNEIPEKIVPLWQMIVKQLQGPMPFMIEAATLLSAILKQWAPFGILISILAINTFIGFHEEKKAKDALDGLKNSMVTTVNISFSVFFFFFSSFFLCCIYE